MGLLHWFEIKIGLQATYVAQKCGGNAIGFSQITISKNPGKIKWSIPRYASPAASARTVLATFSYGLLDWYESNIDTQPTSKLRNVMGLFVMSFAAKGEASPCCGWLVMTHWCFLIFQKENGHWSISVVLSLYAALAGPLPLALGKRVSDMHTNPIVALIGHRSNNTTPPLDAMILEM